MDRKHMRMLLITLTSILAANVIYMIEYRQVSSLGNFGANLTKAVLSSVMPVIPVDNIQSPDNGNAILMLSRLSPLKPQGAAFLMSMNSPVYKYYEKENQLSDNENDINGNNYGNGYNGNGNNYDYNENFSDNSDDIIWQDTTLPGDFEFPVASSIYMDEEGGREDERTDDSHADYETPVAVNNSTGLSLNVINLLASPLAFNISETWPQVLIVHTHTTEAYTGGMSSTATRNSTDNERNVTKVGSEIAKKLQNTYGIGTIQIKTIHDLPDYNMAYTNALKTITSTLNKYPSIKVVIDIHRDGIAGDMPFNTTTTVNGKKAARVMPVIGTSASGLPHPFWKDNAIFGIKFAFEINKIAPGLSRPVYISEYRYNQHISKGSIIIEVGGDGNSISEAVVSASYIADAIAAVIK